ncbi:MULTISPECIES: peptidoglycan DD-metalloendopeptidase family protein [unclassified Campylobacter]|uniref:murein hydrolase activator EnvC family protein n=1 Tax=Campylobacter TaxID=194 RepID=UPI00147660FA|nr:MULTISPECIES: peptidoglycan DD-metalloendopeptidase family protein [unclassified Campylobacter]
MRIFTLLFFCFSLAFCATTNEKIKVQTSSLEISKEIEKQLNKKLDDLAKDILAGEDAVKQSDKKMKEVIAQIADLEKNAIDANSELRDLTEQNKELLENQKYIEQSLIRIIADHFAFDLITPKEYEDSNESIIATEILSNLNSVLKEDFKNLAKDYEKTLELIKTQNKKIENIKSNLKGYKEKQSELAALQEAQSKTLANLKKDKNNYSRQLSVIHKEQKEIRKTLEQLKILAKEESEAAKKEAEKKAKEAAKKSKDKKSDGSTQIVINKTTPDDSDVKQIGSSYQASKVKKYSGEKTIAPLDSFTVKQKFGNYIDPIYNIKIFNESVVLSSNSPNAKVKSVLSGKVVFAKDTAMLDKVVIIENANGIHTIYAHLSQIAPTIKVGSKVPRGYVIGRVARDLTFEVTQKNYHINPLEMISLK